MMEEIRPRKAHWIKLNHQNRIPKRWIALDTESNRHLARGVETQDWRLACAYRWRSDLKSSDATEREHFWTPETLWQWVDEYCRPEQRTVVWAHNLGYDIRISQAFDILPALGWRLDWCNLSTSVSSMTWRGPRGTLVFADTYSWLPMPLEDIGELVGVPKMHMPNGRGTGKEWIEYCYRDAEIVSLAVKELVKFIDVQDLGNWQPTGAGMSYATWRHKFMTEKVLVHDDEEALSAERAAMHTGRAEAWRHGSPNETEWYEVDFRQAYTRIAATVELPTKLKWHNGLLSLHQYKELRSRFRVLAKCEVRTTLPVVPWHSGKRHVWPSGRFTSWLWDAEVDSLLDEGGQVRILEAYVYTKHPVLQKWAEWVLATQALPDDVASPVVKKWVKHSGRTLIGRLSLRAPQWAVWGANPEGEQGISYMVDNDTGKVTRMMHVGDQTYEEVAKLEGQDSVPQITGYIMSVCRTWLWKAMRSAGLENIAHVDTDSVIVNADGLARLQAAYGDDFPRVWQIKARYTNMTVYGPRNYRGDSVRKTSGVPRGALEVAPNVFEGESWSSLSADLSARRTASVTVTRKKWELTQQDPRRMDAAGAGTFTRPLVVDQSSNDSPSSASAPGIGS